MPNLIMQIGVILFFILFLQLAFTFVLFIISLIKKPRYTQEFTPSVSVLIPTYNEERNIRRCLDAVLATKYSGTQIIVIDDGSTDGTLKILESYKKSNKNIIVLKQALKGKVAALNFGTKHSKHEFLFSIDADTHVNKDFFIEMLKPFADKKVGAVSGAVLVENKSGFFQSFQVLEYTYNNIIRQSFSSVFSSGIWFFGCVGAYRKSVLKSIGGFKEDTMTEDMDISVEYVQAGYKAIYAPKAIGHTSVPKTFISLFKQRSRWWVGGLQTIVKHFDMLVRNSSFALKYVFANHLWWAFYAILALPLFVYQIHFWWPLPESGAFGIFAYLFRWFSLSGPIYVIYMNATNQWAFTLYNIFGILSGLISAIMLTASLIIYKEKNWFKNSVFIFFYFPYSLILNVIMAGSVIRFFSQKSTYFIK